MRAGAGEKGNGRARGHSHRPSHATEFFNFPVFFLFSRFLAVSSLKEPLRRREKSGQ